MDTYTQYVHEFENRYGQIRYGVAIWDEEHGQFQCPLTITERELTGCHTEFSRKIEGLGGYKTKKQALARARYLFGKIQEN